MFSSFGFDSKGAGRNNHSGSRLFPALNAPRGFSVHVFKNPTLPTHAPPVIPPGAVVPTRPSTGGGQWNRQASYHSDVERKQVGVPVPPSQDRRLVQVGAVNEAWPVEKKYTQSHSKSGKPYGIYPSLSSDVYIYERSISSVSLDDEMSGSPSSDSSSDSDLFPLDHTATYASVEVSSTRASSSTETLESTLISGRRTISRPNANVPPPSLLPPPPRPALASAPTRPQADSTNTSRPVVPLTRTESLAPRNIAVSRAGVPPIQLASAPLDNSDDSDSDTVISDSHVNDMVVDMHGAQWAAPPSYYPMRGPAPYRRDSNDRVPPSTNGAPPLARTASASRDVRDMPTTRPTVPPAQYQHRAGSPRGDDASPPHPRAPPGLSESQHAHAGGVATPPDGSPRSAREPASSSSSATHSAGSRSPPVAAPPLQARTMSSRPVPQQAQFPPGSAGSLPGPQPRNGEFAGGSSSSYSPPLGSSPPASSSPPRRDTRTPSPQEAFHTSNYATTMGAPRPPSPEVSSTAPGGGILVVASSKRNVRWTENLVCPSPVPVERRRKGWFNRRGDQLWTNEGQYKAPQQGQEYPPDLAYYPEPNAGWMNEEGVRIDMAHRLIPKQPLRPALKRAKQPLTA